jgi:hypothetical protein
MNTARPGVGIAKAGTAKEQSRGGDAMSRNPAQSANDGGISASRAHASPNARLYTSHSESRFQGAAGACFSLNLGRLRWCHPEWSRFSGGARDLPLARPFSGEIPRSAGENADHRNDALRILIQAESLLAAGAEGDYFGNTTFGPCSASPTHWYPQLLLPGSVVNPCDK